MMIRIWIQYLLILFTITMASGTCVGSPTVFDVSRDNRESQEFWQHAIVLIAQVKKVNESNDRWLQLTVVPVATMLGDFDCISKPSVTIRMRRAMWYVDMIPKAGDNLLIVVNRVDPKTDKVDFAKQGAPAAELGVPPVYIQFSNTNGPICRFEGIQDPNIEKFREGIRGILRGEDATLEERE